MTSRPDQDFKWIFHMRDHFSKFSWAYPLVSKHASEVAEKLVDIFSLFGPPKILQSDNGKEFVATVIKELANVWKGLIIINGRPRHPQSQGCVERGNGDLQIKLGKWMEVNGDSWSLGLKFVVYAINTSAAETTGKTPYEIVIGQSARCNLAELEELSKQGLLDETDFETDTNILAEEKPRINDKISGASFSDQEKQSEKLISNYILQYQGFIVAKGINVKNRSVIHGYEFNTQSHSIMEITEFVDADS